MAASVPEWDFYLADAISLEEIGPLKNCKNRQMTWTLNGAGSAQLDAPNNSSIAAEVEPGKTALIAKRDDEPKWSGLIAQTDDTLPGTRFSIQAVGWLTLFDYRILPQELTTTAGWQIANTDTGLIAIDLLEYTNGVLPTLITPGTWQPSTSINRSYTGDVQIGQEIRALSDIEDSFDYEVTPDTRQFNIYTHKGQTKSDVLFGYGTFPRNLSTVNRKVDALQIMNDMRARGPYGYAEFQDHVSQSVYGLYQQIASLSDVNDPDVLMGYATAEVTLRARPQVIWTITPKRTKATGIRVFDNFDIGDNIYFSAVGGKRVNVRRQAIRVFSFSINLSDDGKHSEQVTSLQATYSQQGAGV